MLERIIPYAIAGVYHFLLHTIRWQVVGPAFRPGESAPCIYAFWHARLLMMPRITCGGKWPGYMLISEHRDGGLIADTMRLLDIPVLRGSSTRGGTRALLRMIRAARRERCFLGITPDGPRGPREVVKDGVVYLARATGLPIVPVCYATRRAWRVKSWDRFYIPQPFTSGVFVFGEPVFVAADEALDQARARVQRAMDENRRRADDWFSD